MPLLLHETTFPIFGKTSSSTRKRRRKEKKYTECHGRLSVGHDPPAATRLYGAFAGKEFLEEASQTNASYPGFGAP